MGVVQMLAVDEEGQQTTIGMVSLLCPTRVPPLFCSLAMPVLAAQPSISSKQSNASRARSSLSDFPFYQLLGV